MKKFKVGFNVKDKTGAAKWFEKVIETKDSGSAKRLVELEYPTAYGISVSEYR